jgi:hypothetical protein
MAYLNFSEALTEAKRRAALQGREVSSQEAAGLSRGIAESSADRAVQLEGLEQNKEQFEKQFGQQKTQYEGTMAENKRQYDESLSTQQRQFDESLSTQQRQFSQQMENTAKEYQLSVQTLEAQIRQFEESSATQRAQFGEQMAFQIAESARAAREWQRQLDLQREQFAAQLLAADANLPASFAPQGWNSASYLANNPDVASSAYWGQRPLNHWYSTGRLEGRTW